MDVRIEGRSLQRIVAANVRSVVVLLVALVCAFCFLSPALSSAPRRTPVRSSRPVGRSAAPSRRAAVLTRSTQHPASTLHFGIYMLGSRVGSSDVTQTPATFEGRKAQQVDAKVNIKVVALAAIEQKIDLRQVLDTEGRPLSLRMSMESGGHTTNVDARFSEKQVDCTVESGGTKSQKVVPIPPGVSLIADPDQIGPKGKAAKLKPGTKMQLHMFEPATLQILPVELEVLPAETITIAGKSYRATVIKATDPLTGESKSWVDEAGELLQQESLLGVRMVRESGGAPPPSTAYVPPRDFAVATSIRTKTVISDPREVHLLRLRVQGIPDRRLVLSDPRQTAEIAENAGKLTVTYTIRAAAGGVKGDEGDGVKAEITAPDPDEPAGQPPSPHQVITPSPHQQYLSAAPYLEVDDPRIQRQAKEIVGDATDAIEKARRIRAWVHEHMTPQMDIGVIRSATDVLQHPVGVCRDYAVLYTALARAAGVPARVCGGIVYFRDGFYYHAWSEVQPAPGADWVAFDATLPSDFVDATHLKFAQGDPTAMFQAGRVVGRLQAEVLEYR
jgi:hypothetical protein